ncbi:hypothetical protein DENIS_0978 [Desulfonema ishimotonii]|uniref:Methyltransferase type 11 domain-containing protein n=1 Tax=Desulfonema ishimotonii TaxID=45657 RepID=A0A401FSV7_9BACT|nr:class I SAM-dependent methyltransferase [Desulfonema ishimotonii]GBC60036.1 hypothetical protein DENIS_0978 [Desulfonema ishimotonii]
MRKNLDAYASMALMLQWQSQNATHTDCYYAERVNFWRDHFPARLYDELLRQDEGERTEMSFRAGEALPAFQPDRVFDIRHCQFEDGPDGGPRRGRFYPKGVLRDVANVFRANMAPFRCAEVGDSAIRVDFNHPLAKKDLRVRTVIDRIWEKESDTGGSCADWMETLSDGPGMQSRRNGRATDFFSGSPFAREDERPDSRFYASPRFVSHIDETAMHTVSQLYGELLRPGMRVLDLMSSWQSHLPARTEMSHVTGLGLNAEELMRNERLDDHVVRDLNENPVLPFDDASYDASVCTVSVEYLTRPFEVFREISRVLKPGGQFIVSFSNRWFPPKVINIWHELHEFERMGMVLEYFLASARFEDLHTWSMRGKPRPVNDKYYGEQIFSDPVYCVRGRRA